jgi:acyl-CoA thioester hydrolase
MSKPPVFVQRRVVEFHETDAAGLAHFTSIFRWMEAAEHAFLRERGVPITEKNTGWPRAEVCAHFHAPLRFGDEVETRVFVRVRHPARVNFNFEIWRVSGPGAPQRCASAEFTNVRVVLSKGKLRPAPLSAAQVKKLEAP